MLHLLLRHTQSLITQMVQTAACNRHHSLDQQLCRWLLLSLDRLQGTEMVMTQQLIANMMGVPREGATEGGIKLQNTGFARWIVRGWRSAPASAMRSSEGNTTACYPTS